MLARRDSLTAEKSVSRHGHGVTTNKTRPRENQYGITSTRLANGLLHDFSRSEHEDVSEV